MVAAAIDRPPGRRAGAAQGRRAGPGPGRARAAEERKRRTLVAGLAASLLALAALGGGGGIWVARDRAARVEALTRRGRRGDAVGIPAAGPGPRRPEGD